MNTKIYITLKAGLLDAQGKTIKAALQQLGFDQVKDVRVGKYIELNLDAHNAKEAQELVGQMCQKLLANPVIETHRVEFDARAGAGDACCSTAAHAKPSACCGESGS